MNIIQHTHPQPHTCRTWLRRADYWPRTKRIAALISMLVAPGALAAEDHAAASGELLADFTGPDYAGWTVIGPAFGKSPDSLEGWTATLSGAWRRPAACWTRARVRTDRSSLPNS